MSDDLKLANIRDSGNARVSARQKEPLSAIDAPIVDSPTQRAFEILELIARNGLVSVGDIIAATDIPRTTAHRLVNHLEAFGFIHRALARGRYQVGPRLVQLASDTLCAASRSTGAHALLSEVARVVVGTSSLAILQDGEVVYINSAVADSPLLLRFQTGQRAPLYCTSNGKVFLASMERKLFEEYMSLGTRRGLTARTIVDEKRLRAEIQNARKLGYAMADSEYVDGVVGTAVPIKGKRGVPIAALTVSVPAARHSVEELKQFLPFLQMTADKFSNIYLSDH